jgi:hypothetical protein
LYSAAISVPTMPAVNPMLYRLRPMWALKSWAAAGGRMKPINRPVASASGSATGRVRVVLKRISEKTGGSAAPKKAVLMWAANGSPRKRAWR